MIDVGIGKWEKRCNKLHLDTLNLRSIIFEPLENMDWGKTESLEGVK